MQNPRMERSAAYSGILGALLFVASGMLPGAFPPLSTSSQQIASYMASHAFAMTLSAWLMLPSAAFIIWFAAGLFDYLRDAADSDRTLAQWGMAAIVTWAALTLVAMALQAAGVIASASSTAYSAFFVFDVTLFVFAMGAFAAFAFAAAHEGRRQKAMPGWLNVFGYLVFLVDLAYTLSIFATTTSLGMAGIGAYVAPFASALWIIVVSIALLRRT